MSNDVGLLEVWREAFDSINHNCLRIDDKAGNSQTVLVRATDKPAEIGVVELALIFVKCYHTEAAVRNARPLIGPQTTVLSLQNGWGNGPRIAAIVGREKLLLGVCYHSASVLGPGHVLHSGQGKTFVGELDGRMTPRLNQIAGVFAKAGIEATATPQVLKEIWSKLKPKGGNMGEVTNEQVNLMLRLYEERREPKLREARDWFAANCSDPARRRALNIEKRAALVHKRNLSAKWSPHSRSSMKPPAITWRACVGPGSGTG